MSASLLQITGLIKALMRLPHLARLPALRGRCPCQPGPSFSGGDLHQNAFGIIGRMGASDGSAGQCPPNGCSAHCSCLLYLFCGNTAIYNWMWPQVLCQVQGCSQSSGSDKSLLCWGTKITSISSLFGYLAKDSSRNSLTTEKKKRKLVFFLLPRKGR